MVQRYRWFGFFFQLVARASSSSALLAISDGGPAAQQPPSLHIAGFFHVRLARHFSRIYRIRSIYAHSVLFFE
jgi:hypothetical protein